MSTYLLLRNNKQTGPFTLDELKKMSLKAYDLVWVEGKSAAWRYPGEIPEFISFAPAVPEQPFDRFYKKTKPGTVLTEEKPVIGSPGEAKAAGEMKAVAKTDTVSVRTDPTSNTVVDSREESSHTPAPNPNRESRDSVYINLPGLEKKPPGNAPVIPSHEPIDLDWDEPRESPMVKIPSSKRKPGRKALVIGSVVVFFIAGMLTGFYISNRRNFYSTYGDAPRQETVRVKSPELTQSSFDGSGSLPDIKKDKIPESKKESILPEQENQLNSRSKKKLNTAEQERSDSALAAALAAAEHRATDSAQKKQEAEMKRKALEARISAHPEEYLLITTGNFKTGLLGGISETPVTLTNRSGVKMDLVVVAIDYILHNKKIFKTENLSFHDIAPGETATVTAPKSSRGVNITYRLTVANSQQIGMAYSNFK